MTASMSALQNRKRPPSMVRQSDFDPTQGPATFYDPTERYRSLLSSYDANPGRAPQGSGSTGLMSGDKHGYSQMLNEQTEFLRLEDLMGGGRGEVNVRADPRSNFKSALNPLAGDARFPMRKPFEANRDFFSAPGASLSGAPASSLQALRSRGGY